MISLFQLDRLWLEIKSTALKNIERVGSAGTFQDGQYTKEIENIILPSLSGRKFALTVASGSDALFIALQALGLSPGSRVAVPTYSFLASASSILRAGMVPVILDVDEDCLLNLDLVEAVEAVVAVDLYGLAMDYGKLLSLGVPTVMDGAQSIETKWAGMSSLKVGFISTTSFAPTKTVPVFGSGGAIFTDDVEAAGRCSLLRNHGKASRHSPAIEAGINSRLGEMEAAQLIACFQLHERWHQRRLFIADVYRENLSAKFRVPSIRGTHTWHKFVIRTPYRDKLKDHLASKNIESGLYYDRLIHQEPTMHDFVKGTYDIAERVQRESLAIPVAHTLTDGEVEQVVSALRSF